jgi:uncharacterized protein YprB with RNaseH-like and TPR domain
LPEPRILILDIETSPNLAYCWGIWKENIGLDQLINTSELICWAAKWYHEDKILYRSVYHDSKKKMLKSLRNLLHDADIVVHYNGRKFDIPTINKDLIMNNIPAPRPYKQVDLIETAKHTFRFQSNRLEFICRQLGIGEKEKHSGFNLWKKCMEKDPVSWETMKKYNIKDVLITEKLYDKLKPWMKTHPKLYDVEERTCPYCNSHNVIKHKNRIAEKYTYTQYQCKDCRQYYSGNRVKK